MQPSLQSKSHMINDKILTPMKIGKCDLPAQVEDFDTKDTHDISVSPSEASNTPSEELKKLLDSIDFFKSKDRKDKIFGAFCKRKTKRNQHKFIWAQESRNNSFVRPVTHELGKLYFDYLIPQIFISMLEHP